MQSSGRRAIRVLSSLALKGVLEALRPQLERELAPLVLDFDATAALVPRLQAGEPADLAVLSREAMDELHACGAVERTWLLGGSGVGIAVRAGAAHPDIGTVERLRDALLAADSVAHSRVGASGLYFAELLETLGVARHIRRRVVVDKGPVGLVVARGEAALGVQQLCELAPVSGIEIVGPLPSPVQRVTWFSAGIPARAANAQGAAALVEALLSDSGRAAMRAGGLVPHSTIVE